MSGISSKSFGTIVNKKKYNGYEYNTDFNSNLYESFYRSHDPQLGRFWQLDPKPTYPIGLYAAMNNNPVLYNDLLGDTINVTARKGFLGLGGKMTIRYEGGKLFNQDGTAYSGKVKGFLKQTVNGLDNIRTGGVAGANFISDLEKGASFAITKTGEGNSTSSSGSGIKWNPTDKRLQMPNASGTAGRPAWIGLAHELGHQ